MDISAGDPTRTANVSAAEAGVCCERHRDSGSLGAQAPSGHRHLKVHRPEVLAGAVLAGPHEDDCQDGLARLPQPELHELVAVIVILFSAFLPSLRIVRGRRGCGAPIPRGSNRPRQRAPWSGRRTPRRGRGSYSPAATTPVLDNAQEAIGVPSHLLDERTALFIDVRDRDRRCPLNRVECNVLYRSDLCGKVAVPEERLYERHVQIGWLVLPEGRVDGSKAGGGASSHRYCEREARRPFICVVRYKVAALQINVRRERVLDKLDLQDKGCSGVGWWLSEQQNGGQRTCAS